MKKILTISILFVLMLAISTTMVSATTKAELPDALMAIGQKYGATASDKIKVERYVQDNEVTEAQANAIVAKANEIAAVMDKAGVTNYKSLNAAQKEQVKTLANQAANIIGLTLSFKNNSVEVYKNGKLIDTVTTSSSTGTAATGSTASAGTTKTLVYTGSNAYVFAIAGVVALAVIGIVGKKVVNA